MTVRDVEYRKVVELAEHYLAVGQTEVYLHTRWVGVPTADTAPWEHVTKVEPGGTHRIDIRTEVRFTAPHPCGITFEWTVGLEDPGANGRGGYVVAVDRVRAVMSLLSPEGKRQYAEYLADCAKKVRERGDELRSGANSQYAYAYTLGGLLLAEEEVKS